MPSKATISRFLKKAKEASNYSTYPRQHLGAVLVYGNKIIAIGYNTNKTNPMQYKYNKFRGFDHFNSPNNGSIHAEGMILVKTRFLDIDWSKTTIYIYREFKRGGLALSKPCSGCEIALLERGIGTVIFTTEEGYNLWRLTPNGYEEMKGEKL